MSILTIPKELQLHIIGLLPVRERLRLSETCHGLRDLVRDPSLWKKLVLCSDMIKNKTKACRDHVARCSNLRELIIIYSSHRFRSDQIMSVVMKAKKTLTALTLDRFDLSNSAFKQISKLTQLTELDFNASSVKSDGFSSLANLSKLRSLKISNLRDWYHGHITFKDVEEVFSTLKQLEEVEMRSSRSYLKDEIIESLVRNNKKLHVLKINTAFAYQDSKLSSKSLNFIAANCPQLTHIEIGGHRVFKNADIIDLISKCSKLKHANFEYTQIEDSALARLALGCPDLEYLKLLECHEITEQGIEAFLQTASQAKLKHLDIRVFGNRRVFAERLKQEHPKIRIVNNTL